MVNFGEKSQNKKAGNLNSGRSYVITTVPVRFISVTQKGHIRHQTFATHSTVNLNTIGACWYFERVLVPLRLKNQSLYHKILLLQKFNDKWGKVLKPKKISLQPQKKNEAVYDCV